MSTEAANPVCLITGGAQRLGAQTARFLHARGLNLVIHYRNSQRQALELQQELQQARGDSVLLLQGDLASQCDFGGWRDAIMAGFGRLDLLINNASSYYPTPVDAINMQQWDDLVGSNLRGPLFISQAMAPLLRKKGGCIVNMVDIHGERPLQEHCIYSVAKAGNIMLVKSLAKELAPQVRVNGIAPGSILWPTHQDDPQSQASILQRTALKRSGTPQDIVQAIWFLYRHAPYITGQILRVDGGRSLHQ